MYNMKAIRSIFFVFVLGKPTHAFSLQFLHTSNFSGVQSHERLNNIKNCHEYSAK